MEASHRCNAYRGSALRGLVSVSACIRVGKALGSRAMRIVQLRALDGYFAGIPPWLPQPRHDRRPLRIWTLGITSAGGGSSWPIGGAVRRRQSRLVDLGRFGGCSKGRRPGSQAEAGVQVRTMRGGQLRKEQSVMAQIGIIGGTFRSAQSERMA